METKLNLISKRALKDRKCKFNNLMHLINVENLTECFHLLKRDKATGIDNVSMDEYGAKLNENLTDLIKRMKSFSYRPQAVRRVNIPKPNGKLRPLGIPCVEDKVVQMGISRILTAIYETDFLDCSYGFRPNRSCHDALNALDKVIMTEPINYVIDADIKGFFDNVDQKWLLQCLQVRITDQNLLRYIVRILKSGVMENGAKVETNKGTPQGGVISPVLANIYLHYILDLWFEKVVKRHVHGVVEMVRYADDFVICVENESDANRILDALKKRLQKFSLELAEDKTKIIRLCRKGNDDENHDKQVKSFNFLGFTHFCDKTRKGHFKLGRTTDKKKFSTKLKEMNIWLKSTRNILPIKEIWCILSAKLRGHFQYYGVSGNFRGIKRFNFNTIRLVFKWLNRRSQKKSFNWQEFQVYLERFPLPKPKIYHNLYTLYRF